MQRDSQEVTLAQRGRSYTYFQPHARTMWSTLDRSCSRLLSCHVLGWYQSALSGPFKQTGVRRSDKHRRNPRWSRAKSLGKSISGAGAVFVSGSETPFDDVQSTITPMRIAALYSEGTTQERDD